jgi:chromosome segregation ATPase
MVKNINQELQQLRIENAALRNENAKLKNENTKMQQSFLNISARIAQADAAADGLAEEVEAMRKDRQARRDQLFNHSGTTTAPGNLPVSGKTNSRP